MVVKVGTAKIWDGSAWQAAVPTWAKFSTTPTGNYTDGESVEWDYWIYKANGTLVATTEGLVEFLVVGGGGSGASNNTPKYAGGGGAGGCRVPFPGETINAGTFAVTVGAGGASSGQDNNGNAGTNSSIGSDIVGLGGGFGGNRYFSGGAGGAGGGGGQWHTGVYPIDSLGGAGTYYQGYRGGESVTSQTLAGGGGGAGAQGTDSVDGSGGLAGGIGIITTIISDTIATAQSVGEVDSGNVYFGGGGGTAIGGAGGLGGGTDGSADGGGSANAAANTGGGTGGADWNDGTYSGIGGSGVVIVRTRV
jgi:hypothetical protein